jgi:hypothetical protein
MKSYQWLAWLATVAVLISAAMASINLYPWYSLGFIIANTLWMIIGILWREKSMIVMNLGLNAIYLIGLLVK